jgi:hypothetical protein
LLRPAPISEEVEGVGADAGLLAPARHVSKLEPVPD